MKSLCEASCRGLYAVSTQERAEGRNNQSIRASKGLWSRTTNGQPTMFVNMVRKVDIIGIICISSGAAPAPRRCNESPIQPLSNHQTIKPSNTLGTIQPCRPSTHLRSIQRLLACGRKPDEHNLRPGRRKKALIDHNRGHRLPVALSWVGSLGSFA